MKLSKLLIINFFVITATIGSVEAKSRNAAITGLKVGNRTPEIVENSPSGTPLKLSSLKGKMVLIDFWASWCGPCRRENPIVVSAFQKYQNASFKGGKGFTVFSVSLDRNAISWKNAIAADQLVWNTHVSDLKYRQSKHARTYQVTSIPANFLIDGEGIIQAVNLRGEALSQKLEELKK